MSFRYPINDAEHTVLLLPTFVSELLELTWGKEVADRRQDQVPAPQSIQQFLNAASLSRTGQHEGTVKLTVNAPASLLQANFNRSSPGASQSQSQSWAPTPTAGRSSPSVDPLLCVSSQDAMECCLRTTAMLGGGGDRGGNEYQTHRLWR